MEDMSKEINEEILASKGPPEANIPPSPETIVSASEKIEKHKKLEDLEESNGKDDSQEPNLDELEYADGKERDELDLVEEQEKIFGTDLLSPFKTADKRIFTRRLDSMSQEEMSRMAERNGARIFANPEEQKKELLKVFCSWASSNGYFQTEATKKQEKGARAEAFEQSDSVKELEDKLKSKTLSDLQSTAARLGFNPGFDRDRLIALIKQEYQRQS